MISRRRFLDTAATVGSFVEGRTEALEAGQPARPRVDGAATRGAPYGAAARSTILWCCACSVQEAWLGHNMDRYRAAIARAACIPVMRSRLAEDELACGAPGTPVGIRGLVRVPKPVRASPEGFRSRSSGDATMETRAAAGDGNRNTMSLTFAPVDFEQQSLTDGLRRAGFGRRNGIHFVARGDHISRGQPPSGPCAMSPPPAPNATFDFCQQARWRTRRRARERIGAARIGEP